MNAAIRPFQPSPEEYEAVVAAWNAAWPEMYFGVDEVQHGDESHNPAYHFQRFVAEVNGAIVALAHVDEPEMFHEPGRYQVVVVVHPDYQRRGIGGQLYGHLTAHLATRNPPAVTLMSYTHENKTEAVRFLTARGFEQVLREPVSWLDVAGFDPAAFAGVLERVRRSNVRLVRLDALQAAAPDWRERLYQLEWELIQDIPAPVSHQREAFETWVAQRFEGPWFRPDAWTIAVENDRWIGMSVLWKVDSQPQKLYSGLTGVIRSRRRRGIATALKVQGIQFAGDYGAATIETVNEENNPMYRLNLKLGFEPLAAMVTFENRSPG
jgi:GNAT superfamily N-acetyltransferase